MTGQPLAHKHLTPNLRLKAIIQGFQARLHQIQQEPPVSPISSVAPLQFSNALSQRLPPTQTGVAISSQPLNREVSNDAVEQCNLGIMYLQGQGVTKDYVKAFECFGRAAAQGHATAQYNLGMMCGQGKRVVQNYTKAREWYKIAAAQGYARAGKALQALAQMHELTSSSRMRP